MEQNEQKSQAHGRIYDSITQIVGATPLVRLPGFRRKHALEADILVKLEYTNPWGSVKDRAMLAAIEEAEAAGKIKPGHTTIIEPSAGNSGISLAALCAAKGYELIITMPENTLFDRRKLIEFYGASIILTPADRGMRGATERMEELLKEKGEAAHTFDLFKNQAGPQAHYQTTAREIWDDCGGAVDIIVAGVGSGATISGLGHAFKKLKPEVQIFGVEPAESPVLSEKDCIPKQHSISGIGVGFKPEILDMSVISGMKTVPSARAYEIAKEAAQSDGVPVGISSGAALAAALEIAQSEEGKGKTIVVIFPSGAERYLSTPLFEVPETKI